jgi:WD40 repeat protein
MHSASIRSLAIAPNSMVLATASDDSSVRLLELATGRLLALYGHVDGVNGVSFSPDSTMVASAGTDGVVCLWSFGFSRAAPAEPSGVKRWLEQQTVPLRQ